MNILIFFIFSLFSWILTLAPDPLFVAMLEVAMGQEEGQLLRVQTTQNIGGR